MSRSEDGPELHPGRGQRDDPPPRLKECRVGRAIYHLASDDFRLLFFDGKTRLIAVAPTSADSRVVRQEGSFPDWNRKEWIAFTEKAEKFDRPDLLEDLNQLKSAIIEQRISQERPVVDDDSSETLMGVHSLLVHFSRADDYLRVRGSATRQHRRKLKSFGLRWNPSIAEWESGFSEDLLETASRFVEENDRVQNPDEIGYRKCPACGRWNPKESAGCPCRD